MSKPKAAREAAQERAPAELMPEDLRARGWELLEHQGENQDEFQCVNRRDGRNLETRLSRKPQALIESARRMQEKIDANGAVAEGDGGGTAAATFQKTLQRKLSDAELRARLDEWKGMRKQLAGLEAERDDVVKSYKGQIGVVEGEIAAVERLLEEGAEESEVECREAFDYEAGVAITYRCDTDEEVERRQLKPTEMQQRLPAL
jgi:hypothetical protein